MLSALLSFAPAELTAVAGEAVDLGKQGALGGIRTPNLLIRSQMLYPLSYERRLRADGQAEVPSRRDE